MTARDLRGLTFIAKAQPVSTGAYRRLLSMSADMAYRRLRVLRDLSLVCVHVLAQEKPNRFTLAPKGRELLACALDRDPEDLPVPRGIGKTNLEHHDGAVDLYVAMEVATSRSKTLSLAEFLFESQIRKRLGDPKGALVPDAAAVVTQEGHGRIGIAFEVDLGTENPSWVAQHKGVPYCDLHQADGPLLGCRTWRVCCVVPTERRRNVLASALWEADVVEGLWFLASVGAITDRTILTDAWVTARQTPDGYARLVSESPFGPSTRTVQTHCQDGSDGQQERNAAESRGFHPAGTRPFSPRGVA